MKIPPASFTESDLERFFQQLSKMDGSRSVEGKRFLLRRMLTSSISGLAERWLLWTFHQDFYPPFGFPDIEEFKIRPLEGVGLIMSWRDFARIMDDMQEPDVSEYQLEKRIVGFLENVPERVLDWYIRLLQHRLTDGIDMQVVREIAPGLL